MALWNWLFDPAGLTPHGYCLIWAPGLIGLHVASDAVTALSYFSIPLALVWFVRHRHDLQYEWVFYLFGGFILACGLTHLFAVVTLWIPAYGIEGLVKLATAILSVATAIQLWPLIPRLLALPSPAELSRLNQNLSKTLAEQEHTAARLRESEAAVRAANQALERRVAERTADLSAANDQLVAALAEREAIEAALRASKTELEGVVAERTAALAQRDLLLREVYHRVKNNLQIVDGLIMLQARQIGDSAAGQALLGLRSRIYALGLVHQQLMTSSDLQTFDIAPFINELSVNIVEGSANPAVQLSVDACSLQVTLDFAVPLGLLVTELLTNSLKHAMSAEGGEIKVTLAKHAERQVVLTVSDHVRGCRLPDAPAKSVRGLGRRIMAGLVVQLEGTMNVRQDDGMTTEVRLALPEAC